MAIANNVVALGTKSVPDLIRLFLEQFNDGPNRRNSKTSYSYEGDIVRFFKTIINKDISQLSIKDIASVKKSDVIEYRSILFAKGYATASIKRYIDSIRSLYKFFEEDQLEYIDENNKSHHITASIFKLPAIKITDSEPYGSYTDKEVKTMIELAKDLPNGIEKSLAIELASKTAFRISAIVSLKFSDFRKEDGVWVVKTIDKGKVHEKAIHEEFFNRIFATKIDDKLFHFSSKTLERTIGQLNDQMNLDPKRNLSFHSLKKYSMKEVFLLTDKDFAATAQQGNHSSFETSYNYYLEFQNDYSNMASLLVGMEIDLSVFEKLSKEDLLQLIYSSDRDTQNKLLNSLNKKFSE